MNEGKLREPCTSIAPDKMQKHLAVHDSIIRLETFETRLQEFLNKIRGEDDNKPANPEETSPCLSQVLDASPGRINSCTERMHETLDGINQYLYG